MENIVYLDKKTGYVTTAEDVAIAMTGSPAITADVDCEIALLVTLGELVPIREAA